ncbi:CDP-alcohol phosphatidyltransferase family protein [Phycicoccus sp. Root101]|uniref:CDP-alcohol phosphatidyltransferase family protein n=1 Tax=Phycicoccus sp. Root101 TaxID=1736421 RepID=UPI000703BBD2|nr:CDP-alcohol phosphatidyltransferase family protein [Phycicoccus sp. Root101]KQU67662.1 hypothetical protein ASC58_14165 [Phycicoccus sp. Root101]
MTASRAGSPTPRETVALTLSSLRQHGKPQRGAPAYSRFVNRPVGRLIAAVAHTLGLGPNAVTAISAALSTAGIAVLVLGGSSAWVGPVVALLLAAGYAFDSADGQVARLTGGGSARGEWLDHVVDCVKIGTLHLAVALALHREGSSIGWIVVALVYVTVANVFFFTFVLTDLLRRLDAARTAGTDAAPTAVATSPGTAPILRSLVAAPTDYGLLCVLFAFWGVKAMFLPVYALMMLGTALYVAAGAPRWYRSLAPRLSS